MDAPIDSAVLPADTTPAFVGAIDGIEQGMLSGWAVAGSGDPCYVNVSVNGQHLPPLFSDAPRPDLHAKQQSRGLGGWRVSIGNALIEGENRVEARAPDGTPLAGSPAIFTGRGLDVAPPAPPGDAPLGYLGHIDITEPPVLSGWSISSACRAAAVTIAIEGRDPITVAASDPRPDLAAKSLSPGDGGWHVDVTPLLGTGETMIHLRFPDGTDLPGSPLRLGTPATRPRRAKRAAEEHAASEQPAAPVGSSPAAAVASAAPSPTDTAKIAQAAPSPRAPPAEPATAAVSRLQPKPPTRPTLAELDEISLDDLALAVETGAIYVESPPAPPPPEPEEPSAEATVPEPRRRGFLARLFGG